MIPRGGKNSYLKVYFDKCFPVDNVVLTAAIANAPDGSQWFALETST